MNQLEAKKISKLIDTVSKHLGTPMGIEDVLRRCLKNPKNYQSRKLVKMLRELKPFLARSRIQSSPRHKMFWQTVDESFLKAIEVLSGIESFKLSRRKPVVPQKLKKSDSRENVRSVLRLTDLQCPVPFWYAAPELFQTTTVKLAEGSFGEVYEVLKANGEKRILKIVPVGDRNPQTREVQLTFRDIIAELCASLELAKLSSGSRNRSPSFPSLYRVCVVQDVYPDAAIDAWRKYCSNKRSSHPRPNRYKDDQAFITIETEDSGEILGAYPITCCLKAESIFKQVATAVAVAEEELFFEHRDLHVDNILIKECGEEELIFKLRNKRHVIKTYGVKATIIDFTYSRISTTDGTKFMELNNIYQPEPDSPRKFLDHHYVYSQMEEITRSQWSTFSPKTNILWLKHIAEFLWQELKDKDPTCNKETSSQISLLVYNRTCLSYDSASEFVRKIVLA